MENMENAGIMEREEPMEPLVENRFTMTKELFYEGIFRVNRESFGAFTKKMLLVLAALWAVLVAVTLFSNGSVGYALTESVVLILVGVWLCVWMPRSRAKRAWRALEARCGSDLERTVRFYDGWLEVSSSEDEISILYEDVLQVLPAKHLLVLTSEDKVGVLLALDGFTVGSADEVRTLLEQKD